MTDDDRRIAEHLHRYESRVPVDSDASLVVEPRRVPWTAVAAVATVLVLAVFVAAGLVGQQTEVGEASPSAHASRSQGPSPSERVLTSIDAVTLGDGGRQLMVEFVGSPSACIEYEAEIGGDAELLEVTVVGSWRSLPSGTECPAIGEVRTLEVRLEPPFTGSRVRDTVGGTVFTVREPGSSSSPASTATPATPSPTPVIGVAGIAWEGEVGGAVEGTVRRLTAESGRFHALGSRYAGTTEEPVVWSSADGRTWTASEPLPRPSWWADAGAGFFYVDELVSVGERLVAIGSIGFADGLNVVVWESLDGRTWSAIDEGSFHADAYNVNDVTNGPAGLVAITHHYSAGTGSAWRSTDGGRTWTEHRPPGAEVTTTAVVGTVRGYVLGGASNETYDGTSESPRIWTSTDGTNWREASLDGSDGRGRVAQLTVDGSGRWVALGILDGRIVTWRSSDGSSWERTADLGPAVDNQWYGLRLAGVPDGYLVMNSAFPTGVWTSDDGIDWTSTPLPQPSGAADQVDWARGIARIDDTVVIAGQSYAASDPRAWFTLRGSIVR